MAKRPLPPLEYLRQILRCEPETGKLYWLEIPNALSKRDRCWNGKYAHKEALIADNGNGYKVGRIRPYRKLYAHRVVWALTHGEWPEEEIDHVNGIRGDNRLCNLRPANRSENGRNVPVHKDTISGIKGAHWSKRRGWISSIYCNGKTTHLGVFPTKEAAGEAYRNAAALIHGDYSGIYRP